MKSIVLPRVILSLALTGFVGCTAVKSKNEDFLTSYQGFEQESDWNDAIAFKGDLQKLHDYKKVYVETVKVYPPEDLDKFDMTDDATAEEIAKLEVTFREALEKELSEELELASGPGPETLSVRAAALDIQPGNPLLFAATYAPYVGLATSAAGLVTGSNIGAGDAMIEAEVIDSKTRERYFALIDRAAGTKLRPIEGLSRWGHVELAFKSWSKKFRETITTAVEEDG